jgi:plastocyanin
MQMSLNSQLLSTALLFSMLQACAPSSDQQSLVATPEVTASSVSGTTSSSGSSGDSSTVLNISPRSITLTVGDEVTFDANGGSGTYTFSKVNGVGSIVSSTGVYTAPGSAGLATIRVTDSNGSIDEATVRVNSDDDEVDSDLEISPTSLTLSVSETHTFSSSGGATPYSYSVLSGSGSVNSSTGLYTAPATVGNATIRVTDAQGNTSDCGVTILQALLISPSSTNVQASATKTFTASGGVGTYTFSIHAGVGSINSSTGVYTAPVSSGFATVKVTDSNGSNAFASVNIYAALAISPSTISMAEDIHVYCQWWCFTLYIFSGIRFRLDRWSYRSFYCSVHLNYHKYCARN